LPTILDQTTGGYFTIHMNSDFTAKPAGKPWSVTQESVNSHEKPSVDDDSSSVRTSYSSSARTYYSSSVRSSSPPLSPSTLGKDGSFVGDVPPIAGFSSQHIGKVDCGLQDDKKAFHVILLHKLGFNTQSISFLQSQDVTTILHMWFLGTDVIDSWQEEKLLNPVHASILLSLKRHFGHSRTKLKQGNLPTIWYESLTLEVLSQTVLPAPSPKAVAPQVIWIKLQCPSIPDRMSEYSQYKCYPSETYGELLLRYLEYQVGLGHLSDVMKTKLTTLGTNISLYLGPDESQKSKLRADLIETCEGVTFSGK
jgi:hypothetical protein